MSFRFAEIEDSPIGNGSCYFVERRREVPPWRNGAYNFKSKAAADTVF